MDEERENVRRLRALMAEAKPKALPYEKSREGLERVLGDDTLGRILQAMMPGAIRFTRKFGVVGLVTLPIRVYTLIVAGGGLATFGSWTQTHDPLWILKWAGGVAALAAAWFVAAEWWRIEVQDWRKRRSKRDKAGA